MRRREFIAGLGGATAWPVVARAQQRAMPVIGYLTNGSPELFADRLRAFRQRLSEAGFVEGRNVAIDYRWAGDEDRLPALAADLVRRQVNVISAFGGINGALAAKAATTTIPIAFGTDFDPIAAGLVASLNRPGGNITGVVTLGVEVAPKRLELMHVLLPTATMAVLINPASPIADAILRDLQAAARTLGQIHWDVRYTPKQPGRPSHPNPTTETHPDIDRRRAATPSLPSCFTDTGSGRQMGLDLGRHLTDRGLGFGIGQDAIQHDEVVDHPVVAGGDHRNTSLLEPTGVGLTFVAQRIVLRCDGQGRRKPVQLLQAGAERRDIGVVARRGVRSVQIPAVLHEGAGQEPPGAIFMVGLGIHAGVGRWDYQHLVADLGSAAVLGHERQRCGHVAADRIASHRDPAAVRAKLFGVGRYPLQR
jgi:hypothetical protein